MRHRRPHATPTTAAALASAGSENDLRAKASSPAVVVAADRVGLPATERLFHRASTTGADAQATARAAIAALGDGLAARAVSTRRLRDWRSWPPAAARLPRRRDASAARVPEGADADAVASALHGLLTAHGVLNGAITSRTALPLVGESAAVAAAKATDMVEAAAGGTLVIRDAGALCADRSGTAARARSRRRWWRSMRRRARRCWAIRRSGASSPPRRRASPPSSPARRADRSLRRRGRLPLCDPRAATLRLAVAADAGRLSLPPRRRGSCAAGGADGGPRNAALAAAMVAEAVGRLAVRAATAAADSALDTLCSADFGA